MTSVLRVVMSKELRIFVTQNVVFIHKQRFHFYAYSRYKSKQHKSGFNPWLLCFTDCTSNL